MSKKSKVAFLLTSFPIMLSISTPSNAGATSNNLSPSKNFVESATIQSLTAIQTYIDPVKKIITSPQQLCIIYDMDNTILSAEPKLGSDSWMAWNNKLNRNDSEKIPNWNLSLDLHGFEGALRFFVKYYPTESATVATINNLKDNHYYPSIIMTARSYERYYAATQNQLKANNLDYTSNPIGLSPSFGTPITLTPNKDHTAYKAYFNGVYYSADDNKGYEIIELIKQQRKNTHDKKLCQTVIFVDNSQNNIDDVYAVLKNNKDNINLIALRYSAYDSYLIPSASTINSWRVNSNQSDSSQLYNLIYQLNK